MSRLAALLFDLDDTLLFTREVAYCRSCLAACELGLSPPSPTAFDAVYGCLSFQECVQAWHPGVDWDIYRAAYDRVRDWVPYCPVCDVAGLFARLRARGLQLGVVTNGPCAATERKLQALGLGPDDLCVVQHATGRQYRKPDPRCFDEPLAVLRIPAVLVGYVGDSTNDARAALAAGLVFFGVLTGRVSRNDFYQLGVSPTCVLDSVRDIESVL